jgi:hypothetical protein
MGNEDCGQSNGFINVTTSGGTGTLSYLWSNGETTQDLANLPAGTYGLLVTDETMPAACHSSFKVTVGSSTPMVQPICMVTVDSATDHNLVVWENVQATGVDHYNVYRQGCDGGFSLIGSVGAGAITVFEDITSLPFVRSYGYKISAVDACGNESERSPMHKTIHLGINLDEEADTAQLIWDDYMGYPNPIFKIYKKTINLDWSLLFEVAGTQFSYTDLQFNDTTISYAIIVEKPGEPCDAWNGNNKASGGPYYHSSSNLEDEGIVNHTLVNEIEGEVSIYPNPTSNVLNIESLELISTIKLYDISGKLVNSYNSINMKKLRLNVDNYESGIYILEVQGVDLTRKRIVIE